MLFYLGARPTCCLKMHFYRGARPIYSDAPSLFAPCPGEVSAPSKSVNPVLEVTKVSFYRGARPTNCCLEMQFYQGARPTCCLEMLFYRGARPTCCLKMLFYRSLRPTPSFFAPSLFAPCPGEVSAPSKSVNSGPEVTKVSFC